MVIGSAFQIDPLHSAEVMNVKGVTSFNTAATALCFGINKEGFVKTLTLLFTG